MTDWQVVFLGVMAAALVVMAVTQLLVTLTLLRTAREVTTSIRDFRRDVQPLLDKAARMTDDAARVAALALVQAERLDRLVTSISAQIEETVGVIQSAIIQPVRQGAAIIAALRAVMAAIREWQGRSAAPREDDDPLFVG